MSYDKDKDLLDEIQNERNSDNTKESLISLFEGDKNAVFTPSTASTFIGTIITLVVIGTLWWSSVNSRLDQLENTQNEMNTFYEEMRNDLDINNESLYNNLRELEDAVSDMEATYNTDKIISESELKQKLLNINTKLNEVTEDMRELYNSKQQLDLYRKDIDYSIQRVSDRLKRIEEKLNKTD